MKLFFTLLFSLFFTGIVFSNEIPVNIQPDFDIINKNLLTDERYELMKSYAKQHYNMDHANLVDPKMIVVHFTAIPNLELSLRAFEFKEIPYQRERLHAQGKANVGTHYLIDKNGDIYQLYPTTVMVRHVIGFNHTALAIEIVASGEDAIRMAQIQATIKLIHYLSLRYPSIEYLIGHMEYMNQTYDHFNLFLELNKDYEPSIKMDPGFTTMRRIRQYLERDYKLILKK